LPVSGPTDTRGKVAFAYEQADAKLPELFLFHDSFALDLSYLLALEFRRSVFYWQYYFDPALVLHERPDVVVQEFAERALMKSGPVPNPPELERYCELRREFLASGDVALKITDRTEFAAGGYFIVQDVAREPGQRLLLRLDLDAPAASELRVAETVHALAAGRNIVFAEVRGGPYRLEAGSAPGVYVLNDIELRTPPRSAVKD
jgi:hypothetical protein